MTTTHEEQGKDSFSKEIEVSDGDGGDESRPSFSTADPTYQFLLSYQEQNAGHLVIDPRCVYSYSSSIRPLKVFSEQRQQSSAIKLFHG